MSIARYIDLDPTPFELDSLTPDHRRLMEEVATGATYVAGEILVLTRRERAVLETLMVKAGSVVPKARLTADVFGYNDTVGPNALEVYIARLRRKLYNSGLEIVTVRGLGYLMRAV